MHLVLLKRMFIPNSFGSSISHFQRVFFLRNCHINMIFVVLEFLFMSLSEKWAFDINYKEVSTVKDIIHIYIYIYIYRYIYT